MPDTCVRHPHSLLLRRLAEDAEFREPAAVGVFVVDQQNPHQASDGAFRETHIEIDVVSWQPDELCRVYGVAGGIKNAHLRDFKPKSTHGLRDLFRFG